MIPGTEPLTLGNALVIIAVAVLAFALVLVPGYLSGTDGEPE